MFRLRNSKRTTARPSTSRLRTIPTDVPGGCQENVKNSAVPMLRSMLLDDIELDPDNVRLKYDTENVDRLRQALAAALAVGEEYIHPPTVYPIGAKRFRVK